jgi:Stress responsive A/B Barrel Domain
VIVHVVLFRPRPDVGDAERESLFEAMRVAAREIPSVRGFRIGQHIEQPVPYVMSGFPSFPWVALLEFGDEAGLRAYLSHPLHVALGQRFNTAAEAAMIYDYTIADDLR